MTVIDKILIGAILVIAAILGFILLLKLINKFCYGPRSPRPASQDPTVDVSTLKILQFNASWRPNLLHRFNPDFARERAALLLERVAPYDVVCLNDCCSYVGSPVASFVTSMRRRGFAYFARSPPAAIFSDHIFDGGVLLFSKYPILMRDHRSFSPGVGPEEFVARGSLYARVQTGAGTHVHIIAAHAQPEHAGAVPECRSVRFTQLREVRLQLDRVASDGQPVVLVGDLGVDALAPAVKAGDTTNEYMRMATVFQKASYAMIDTLLESQGEHVPTCGAKSTDYILVFNRVDGKYVMSGHNTQVVKFDVEGNANFASLSNHDGVEADILFSLVQANAV
jgi:endonuclease/exonuclease/phosphatase family metal-dependent hydrolase